MDKQMISYKKTITAKINKLLICFFSAALFASAATLQAQPQTTPLGVQHIQRGLNIVKQTDGKTVKVLKK